MIRIKVILRSLLSLRVIRDVHVPVYIVIFALAYLGIIFFVLKTFHHNRDKPH